MIKLTSHFKNKKPIWINPTMIESIEEYCGVYPNDIYTNITMISGEKHRVNESVEEVLNIKNSFK